MERKMVDVQDGDQTKDENLPPGFRFHPTNEELITYYLMNKISDSNFTGRAIADVDLNKCEPWDLPAKAKMGAKEWYFFSLRDRKYPTGVRTNRATSTGYWKTTGKDNEIYNSSTSELVGMKKTLVFYRGRAPRGEKTNWVMHEYRIHSRSAFRTSKDEWVVCRVFQKSAGAKKYPSNQSRAVPPYNLEIGPSVVAPTMMPTENFHFLGRNYVNGADMAEINRVFRNGTMNMSQPMHPPQLNPAAFAVSGLNLNLGGTGAAQTLLRPMMQPQAPGMNHQDVVASLTMTSTGTLRADQGGYGGELDNAGNMANNRYIGMEHCMEMDNYWPSY